MSDFFRRKLKEFLRPNQTLDTQLRMSSKNNDSLSISGHISWWNVQRWFDYSSNFWWFFSAIKYLDSSRSGFSSQGSIHETIRSHAKLTLDSIRHQRSPSSNMGVKHAIFNLDFLPQKYLIFIPFNLVTFCRPPFARSTPSVRPHQPPTSVWCDALCCCAPTPWRLQGEMNLVGALWDIGDDCA